MKLHQINKYKLMAWALPAITLLSTGCTKEFLEPEPLSFYEPSKTFSTQKGLESALASCDKAVRNFFVGDGAPIVSEYVGVDIRAVMTILDGFKRLRIHYIIYLGGKLSPSSVWLLSPLSRQQYWWCPWMASRER